MEHKRGIERRARGSMAMKKTCPCDGEARSGNTVLHREGKECCGCRQPAQDVDQHVARPVPEGCKTVTRADATIKVVSCGPAAALKSHHVPGRDYPRNHSGPETFGPERPLSGLLAPGPVLKPHPHKPSKTTEKIRLQPDRENRFSWKASGGETRDSNPGDGFPPTHFPGVRLRPLGHLSVGRGIAQGRAKKARTKRPDDRHVKKIHFFSRRTPCGRGPTAHIRECD